MTKFPTPKFTSALFLVPLVVLCIVAAAPGPSIVEAQVSASGEVADRADASTAKHVLDNVLEIEMTTKRVWNDPLQGRIVEGQMTFHLSDGSSRSIQYTSVDRSIPPTPVGFKRR